MASSELPSYESLAGQMVHATVDFLRLRLQLVDPISEAIHVVDDATDRASAQRPYQAGPGVDAISGSPITQPPVLSVRVTVDELDQWEENWNAAHEPHADDDGEWASADEGGEAKLARCCGSRRPEGPPPEVVTASTRPFVTVEDYVTAVHPWLVGLRDDILAANGIFVTDDDQPLPADTPLFVWPLVPSPLTIRTPENVEVGRRLLAGFAIKVVQGDLQPIGPPIWLGTQGEEGG